MAIRRFLPLSAWIRSAVMCALSMRRVCAFLNTLSRLRSGHFAHSTWASRAAAYAASMSAGVDCGSSTSTSPV